MLVHPEITPPDNFYHFRDTTDCRDYVVSDIEPIFSASPSVASALSGELDEAGRNTLLSRRFPGGSLKVVAAKAPRNLRRHNVRMLLMDEVDGMAPTAEGSPILLAERRTLSFPDRKIVLGSTPVHEETSHVLRAYAQSDQRIFEVPCPCCGVFAEITWDQITWPAGEPEAARWRCPSCGEEIEERHKPQLVAEGRWRATAPQVQGHAGFRMNALISLHANAAWGKLAAEFVAAKDDPTTLQTFVNTILGQGWRSEGDELDETGMAARAEAFGLALIPAEVLALTVGCDVQHDRLELTYVGWTEAGGMLILGHRVIWGAFDAQETWAELDTLLRERFPHALGGRMAIDATAIDAGDGTSMNVVTGFCRPRTARKIFAIKGAPGNRPVIERAGSKTKTGARLWIVGVDTVKAQLFARLPRVGQVRFSAELPAVWYEQVASERAVVRYSRGQPVRNFERIPGRRAEALDCAVYAFAARQMVNINPEARREDLARVEETPAQRKGPVLQSDWMRRR
ncbi:phage terminase large subunit family protein [Paenirhodobacter sp.]|uniref:phage terminase large subunit family protein n=1 Tax=Paenirhodobacter sp. TaxID=1965326 RepID=UPI003B50E7E1